ncbi:MAG: discoidin domain-containing protein [Prevotellaceae bacterium]|jgi:hypothetical protein|nr:discoidin domain-containing protein [Prevotellaceae bacterium]
MNKNKKSNIILTFLILSAIGFGYFSWHKYQWLNPPYSPEINAVLFLAEDNRPELEKVLKHYGKNPSDSLKLRAAEFLIVNMPGKYSKGYDAPFENVITALLRYDNVPDKQSLMQTFGLGKELIKPDMKYITGEYLINNIDLAFKVWEEQPWGKHVPFDVFCEEILPYRVADEPLENWREKALACFDDLNRSFKQQPGMTAVEACCKVNLQIPCPTWTTFTIPSNYSMIMALRKGTCAEIANLTVFVMRALGIPVSIESIPKWPNNKVGHIWNAVHDSSGRHIIFAGCEWNPGMPHVNMYNPKNKVYRQMFALQNHIQTAAANIPPELRNPFVKDVSMEYEEFIDVEIPVRFPSASSTKYVYLASMGMVRWNMIGWGETDNKTMRFSASTKSVLYMPCYYLDNVMTPANYPFVLNKEREIRYFEPDTTQSCSFTVSEISLTNHQWFFRMLSGVFEGANKNDFSDARKLYTINDVPGNCFNVAKINNPNKFRYVRYVSPKHIDFNCNVAEIKFFALDETLLAGTPAGTSSSIRFNPTMTHDKAFDGNVDTYFDANDTASWTGLDLGKPEQIGEIQYYPRNENEYGINDGQEYELFYWTGKTWQTLGTEKVFNHRLDYKNVPSNALFYLRNATTGKNGARVFTVQDGKQKWL